MVCAWTSYQHDVCALVHVHSCVCTHACGLMHVHYAQHKPTWSSPSELNCLCSLMVQHYRDELHPECHLHRWHVHGQDVCTAHVGCAEMQLGHMHVC